jgi:hypothetical protein
MKLLKTPTLLILSILIISLISSCSKDKEPFMSPFIGIHGLFINSDTIQNLETPIPVGDTLKIPLSLECYMHDIEYLNIKMDREYAKDSIAGQEGFLNFCNPLYTNVEEGVYYFNPGTKNMGIMLLIIPKQAKEDEKSGVPVSISLKSKCNPGDEFNPFYLNFNYFITNKK